MITNILLTGVGGQGILLAARIIASAARSAGFDVTTNEIHGMAQRGGSVTAQIRFGEEVLSPLILEGTRRRARRAGADRGAALQPLPEAGGCCGRCVAPDYSGHRIERAGRLPGRYRRAAGTYVPPPQVRRFRCGGAREIQQSENREHDSSRRPLIRSPAAGRSVARRDCGVRQARLCRVEPACV